MAYEHSFMARMALVITTIAFAGTATASAPVVPRDFLVLATQHLTDTALHGWTVRPVRNHKAPRIDMRDSANARFVRVSGTGAAAWFGKELDRPIQPSAGALMWTWRVITHPNGADLRYRASDDAALRVFVVFERKGWFERIPRTLFYSSGIAETPSYARPSFQSGSMHVIRMTANDSDNQWTETRVDPFADYQRVWGGDARNIVAVGFMQDSEETHSAAVADLRTLQWQPLEVDHDEN